MEKYNIKRCVVSTALIKDRQQAPADANPPETRTADSEINGLDIARGLERYDGDEEAYIKILRSYAANVRSLLMSMEPVATLGEDDTKKLDNFKKTAHAIKGTSYYILAEQVGKQAEALEKASSAGDVLYMKDNTPTFLDTAWKLIGDLDELISAYDFNNPKIVKNEPDKELLSRILDACRRFDMDVPIRTRRRFYGLAAGNPQQHGFKANCGETDGYGDLNIGTK
jgi:HPt (histidine-containing phosphotransfer) domain-containing protein